MPKAEPKEAPKPTAPPSKSEEKEEARRDSGQGRSASGIGITRIFTVLFLRCISCIHPIACLGCFGLYSETHESCSYIFFGKASQKTSLLGSGFAPCARISLPSCRRPVEETAFLKPGRVKSRAVHGKMVPCQP